MTHPYKGHYPYNNTVVGDWDSDATGVYYCGYILNDTLIVHYVGKAVAEGGIRNRLLQHLGEDKWPDVTHFGYCVCTTTNEAETLEAAEIKRLQPKYNKQGK